jgi:hypothetical protein
VTRRLRAAIAALTVSCLLPACGSGEPVARTVVGPNRGIAKRYKNLIGKDGKAFWKPGMPKKMPKGMAKAPPAGSPKS